MAARTLFSGSGTERQTYKTSVGLGPYAGTYALMQGNIAADSRQLGSRKSKGAVKRSAGILMFRLIGAEPMVLLAHPGGPFWRNKESHSWSIPKGEFGGGETAEAAAIREFEEETAFRPAGALFPLGDAVQAGGKRVTAFATEGDLDAARISSVTCEVEWPPKSGRLIRVPEVDRAAWFTMVEARAKIIKGQTIFLDRLDELLQNLL
jgi:predicted NUDIX family NTP pyrophosphohydrolase